jgi:hypothetical protein
MENLSKGGGPDQDEIDMMADNNEPKKVKSAQKLQELKQKSKEGKLKPTPPKQIKEKI